MHRKRVDLKKTEEINYLQTEKNIQVLDELCLSLGSVFKRPESRKGSNSTGHAHLVYKINNQKRHMEISAHWNDPPPPIGMKKNAGQW